MRAQTDSHTTAAFSRSAFSAALAAVAAGMAALLFTACVNDDRSAGVDEFPNSIYARVNTFLDEGKKSESINAVPGGSDGLLVTPGFHVGAGKIAIPKIAAGFSDAAEAGAPLRGLAKAGADTGCVAGPVTITDTVKAPLKTTVNTLAICFDAKFLDSIKGNETVLRGKTVTTFNGGRVETAEITDADGDGILNPKNTAAKANIAFSALEKDILEKTLLVVGPGPDVDFDTESDNVVYAASWARTSGSDTLGYAIYADADSDGIAIDNGKPSVVDLEFYEKGASEDHPDAVWSKANLRMVVKYKVEAKEVRRVRFELETKAGRKEIGEILNDTGGVIFDMRERVHAHFYTIGAGGSDSLDTLNVDLAMTLGADFDSKADDSVYAIDVRTRKNAGDERFARFSFVSDRPIPSGQEPQEGALELSVEYADGTTLTVDGDINPTRMDVTIKDREDKRLHVVWDRQGRGISLEKLE